MTLLPHTFHDIRRLAILLAIAYIIMGVVVAATTLNFDARLGKGQWRDDYLLYHINMIYRAISKEPPSDNDRDYDGSYGYTLPKGGDRV